MENIIIDKTDISPEVKLDISGEISISGMSMMEDPSDFYLQAYNWVNEYISSGKNILNIGFDLSYFNSSSSKQILKLLMAIDEAEIDSKVKWNYPNDNEFLRERGEEFAIMLDLPFEYVAK